jgi:hypothetical protein
MDWQRAIIRNRDALTTIIVALIKSLGFSNGSALTTLPKFIYARALAIIRPAESAVRRLIMIAAHDLNFGDSLLNYSKAADSKAQWWKEFSKLSPTTSIPPFCLIDTLKNFTDEALEFDALEFTFDGHHELANATRISAASLGRRLLALKNALDNLPREAKRLARWYAARDLALRQNKPHRMSPMRPGSPVGLPRRKRNEVQEILRECHLLAIYARDQHDSS